MSCSKGNRFFSKIGLRHVRRVAVIGLLLPVLCAGCAITHDEKHAGVAVAPQTPNETWGVEPVAIRLTANGTMLDFRYRVVDPEKAVPLLSRTVKPYLVDETTGARYGVPDTENIGAIRSTTRDPVAGRELFILFINPGRVLKAGNKVTVVIGDYRKEHLVVE